MLLSLPESVTTNYLPSNLFWPRDQNYGIFIVGIHRGRLHDELTNSHGASSEARLIGRKKK